MGAQQWHWDVSFPLLGSASCFPHGQASISSFKKKPKLQQQKSSLLLFLSLLISTWIQTLSDLCLVFEIFVIMSAIVFITEIPMVLRAAHGM